MRVVQGSRILSCAVRLYVQTICSFAVGHFGANVFHGEIQRTVLDLVDLRISRLDAKVCGRVVGIVARIEQ